MENVLLVKLALLLLCVLTTLYWNNPRKEVRAQQRHHLLLGYVFIGAFSGGSIGWMGILYSVVALLISITLSYVNGSGLVAVKEYARDFVDRRGIDADIYYKCDTTSPNKDQFLVWGLNKGGKAVLSRLKSPKKRGGYEITANELYTLLTNNFANFRVIPHENVGRGLQADYLRANFANEMCAKLATGNSGVMVT